jgi:phosphoglycolate phosphatase
VVSEYREDYAAHALDQTALYPGIAQLLDELSSREVRLAVLSNKPHGPTQALVEKLMPRWRFGSVLGERPGVMRKPHPGAALEIASALELPPEAFFFVGDTAIDMKTAVAAQMMPVGVLWGFRGQAELSSAGARHLLSHPDGFIDLLEARQP